MKRHLPGHSVQTVTEAGWRSHKDKSLVLLAAERFDVLLTVDRKIEKEHDLRSFRIGFVIVKLIWRAFWKCWRMSGKLSTVSGLGRWCTAHGSEYSGACVHLTAGQHGRSWPPRPTPVLPNGGPSRSEPRR
ncbi:MAG: hypothetical protein HY820_02390 [Acidobacteria bacterium]|nr:hypothetical protein [Acidobacteriota bacterium]